MIAYEARQITPDMAKEWLEQNRDNRSIRDSHVAMLARLMLTGEWRLTHQGIAFDEDGRLIDGQHRLWAIVMANVPVMVMVATGLTREAYEGMDRAATRSIADVLHVDRRIVDVANAIIKISAVSSVNLVASDTKRVLEAFKTEIGDVVDIIGSSNHRHITAPVRGAIAIKAAQMLDKGHASEIDAMYSACRQFAIGDQSMPRIYWSLFRQLTEVRGKLVFADQAVRTWIALPVDKTDRSKVTIKDQSIPIKAMRAVIDARLPELRQGLQMAIRIRQRRMDARARTSKATRSLLSIVEDHDRRRAADAILDNAPVIYP